MDYFVQFINFIYYFFTQKLMLNLNAFFYWFDENIFDKLAYMIISLQSIKFIHIKLFFE